MYYLGHRKQHFRQKVKIVNDTHGNVLIVENEAGLRYSAKIDDLVEVLPEVEEVIEIKQQLTLF